jgi:DNA-binding XRE family transcriptional regulator
MAKQRPEKDCPTGRDKAEGATGRRSTTKPLNSVTSASQLPDGFWLAEPLQLAIEARDFGQLLRAYRHARCPELTQETLATLLGITQGQISRIERGITLVQDLAKLTDWTQTLGVPDQYLWFKFDSKS